MFLLSYYTRKNNAKNIRLRDTKTNPIAIINRARIINFDFNFYHFKIILNEISIYTSKYTENIKEEF
jgi:hypothetical protein